jgi:hypothetical protein
MPVLQPDSIVVRPPAGLPASDRVWLEAVGFSIAVADLVFERLRDLLGQLAAPNSSSLHEGTTPAAFGDAWMFVDSAHRLGDLLGRGMGQFKTPEQSRLAREFQGVGKVAFDLRDAVQHVADEARGLAGSGVPVWGALSWAVLVQTEPPLIRTCSLWAGGGGPTVEHRLVNPLGLPFQARVDHINLEAFGMRASLSDVHAAMSSFARELENALNLRFGQAGREAPGGVIIMEIGSAASKP